MPLRFNHGHLISLVAYATKPDTSDRMWYFRECQQDPALERYYWLSGRQRIRFARFVFPMDELCRVFPLSRRLTFIVANVSDGMIPFIRPKTSGHVHRFDYIRFSILAVRHGKRLPCRRILEIGVIYFSEIGVRYGQRSQQITALCSGQNTPRHTRPALLRTPNCQ